MKIYTRTGDGGETGLFAGPRVAKNDARIHAYGEVDELNSVIGMARAAGLPSDEFAVVLRTIQNELFSVGAELATPKVEARGTQVIDDHQVRRLESWIDQFEEQLTPLKQFILPAGTAAATTLHLARAVCRRGERAIVNLAAKSDDAVSPNLLRYINRLSDLLFVLARAANAQAGDMEEFWEKSGGEG